MIENIALVVTYRNNNYGVTVKSVTDVVEENNAISEEVRVASHAPGEMSVTQGVNGGGGGGGV